MTTIIFLNANDTNETKHLDIINGLLESPIVPALASKLCEQFKELPLDLVFSNFVNGLADEVLQKTLDDELNLNVAIK